MEYFRALTFRSISSTHLPPIASKGSLQNWVHIQDCPPDWTIEENDVLPNVDDMREMLNEMEREYAAGKRGVVFRIRQGGRNVDVIASYGKVCYNVYFASLS